MNLIITWIVAFLMAQAVPTRPQYIPEAKETTVEAETRYEAIARDITEVVWDASEVPLFKGPQGRIRTAGVILAIMLHESGFRKDVDLGKGRQAKGDGGKSWCSMQVNLGIAKPNGRTQQRIVLDSNGLFHMEFDGRTGLGGEDLVSDRHNCIRVGLHLVRKSFTSCSRLPVSQWLNSYASGGCDRGREASQNRMGTALRWFGLHKPSFNDADVVVPNVLPGLEMPSKVTLQLFPVQSGLN